MYATVAELRGEGVTATTASDDRLSALISEATSTIDQVTHWFFEPRKRCFRLDGRGSATLECPVPLIQLDRLAIEGHESRLPPESLVVAGAPVSAGFDGAWLTRKDNGVFPRGLGNVVVDGLWGYTEDDGSPTGCTPKAIKRACLLLVLQWLYPLGTDAAMDQRNRWRVIAERTRDQSVSYERAGRYEPEFGDWEIDSILRRYRRPLGLGSV